MKLFKNKYLSNAVWGIIFVGFGYLFEYLNRFIIAKYISIDSLGYFFTGLSIAYMVMSLSLMGLPNEYARRSGEKNVSLFSTFFLYISVFAIINIVLFLFNKEFYLKWIGFFFFSLVLGVYRLTIVRYSILEERKIGLFFQEVANRGGRLLAVIIIIVSGKEYFNLHIGYVLAGVFVSIITIMIIQHNKIFSLEKYISITEVKQLFISSIPLSLGVVAQVSAGRIEFIIPEIMGGATLSDMGVFAIYLTLSQLIVLPSMILTFSLTTKISRLYYEKKYRLIQTEVKNISIIIAISSAFLILLLSLFHESIIHNLFNKNFNVWKTSDVVFFLSGYWLYAISGPLINFLLGAGKYQSYVFSSVITALVRIVLIVLFFQFDFGVDGLIYASFLSFVLMFLMLCFLGRKEIISLSIIKKNKLL